MCRGLLCTTYFSSRCWCDWGTSLIDIQQTSSEVLYRLNLLCDIDGLVKILCDFHTSQMPSPLGFLFLRKGSWFIRSQCCVCFPAQLSNRLSGRFSRNMKVMLLEATVPFNFPHSLITTHRKHELLR